MRNKYKRTIRDKWEKTGFLYGLEEKHKISLSIAYENIATYLLKNENKFSLKTETIIFPCIRRIFYLNNFQEINPIHIIYVLEDIYKNIELKNDIHVDVEAEFCCCFTEYYVRKFYSIKRMIILEKNNYILNSFLLYCKQTGWNFYDKSCSN